jgi:hypothetical protein
MFGGPKQGAIARTSTFLVVLWIFCFERMARGAAEADAADAAAEQAKAAGSGGVAVEDKPADEGAAEGAGTGRASPTAVRKRPVEANSDTSPEIID